MCANIWHQIRDIKWVGNNNLAWSSPKSAVLSKYYIDISNTRVSLLEIM